MATNIEIEAKVLIKENEYKNILNYYKTKILKKYEQINYYIDTPSLQLKHLGIGLRIRFKEGTYMLTLKAPLAEGLLEKNEDISKLAYEAFANNNIFPESYIREFVKMLGVKHEDLKIITELKTLRIEVDSGDSIGEFSVDRNEYNSLIDYELEYAGENIEKVREKLRTICNLTNTFYKDNTKSKQTRALETIKQ
ncbi:MAG TPA: CYTH domain-containing protein [Candidatus Onthovivens sp.]|nr:CYTH domain-containing protein [Candidatus Onthovivens sp.]